MQPDHKALLFLATIATLGAGVRGARAISGRAPAQQPALEHQMQAADSAKRALGGKHRDKTVRSKAPRGAVGATATIAGGGGAGAALSAAPRDYRGRLDMDLATAAQIDSIPGIGPALAKRIVADRMANGAFRELVALRRVKGMSPRMLARLDSLVSFSGAFKPPQPSDTILAVKAPRKRR